MCMKVAINGFGRIGRQFLRAALKKGSSIQLVAINDLVPADQLAHLLEFDSVYGRFDGEVKVNGDQLLVNGTTIKIFAERDPAALPWADLGVDVVIESTGFFADRDGASKHLTAGAKKVIISAPAKNPDATIVLGVNDGDYDPASQHIISMASCTTNCLAPIAKVLDDSFGIVKGLMTTTHAYTADQRLIDAPHRDSRRARAAALSIIPTTTGAAKAVGEVLPALKGKLTGLSLRVPTPTVSVVDLVVELEKPATAEEVNAALAAAADDMVLGYETRPLVSMDYKGDPRSSIVDAASTLAVGDQPSPDGLHPTGNLVKIVSWYDNEWGYSNRLVELTELVGSKL